ncbi:MAG: LysR substrate-binding domain-containing protein [Oricola sp.]
MTGIDLNLLRIFDAMMQERSTTRVGERVGLSQPAVSAALARLRHLMKDDLFVREGNRMVPTAKAEAIHGPLRDAMARIEAALDAAIPFDPATSERAFRIPGSDYFSTLLMPPLSAAVHSEAPAVVLQMIDMPSADVVPALAEGRVDLAVSPDTFEAPDFVSSKRLFNSWLVTVARRNHPVLREHGIRPGSRIPPEVYCAIPHVIMTMDGATRGTIDVPLAERGLSRNILMTLPHFHSVALAAASGEMIGNLPVHYARHVQSYVGIDGYLPPFDPPLVGVDLYWHRRHDTDSANAWLRGKIEEVFSLGNGDLPEDASLREKLERAMKAG